MTAGDIYTIVGAEKQGASSEGMPRLGRRHLAASPDNRQRGQPDPPTQVIRRWPIVWSIAAIVSRVANLPAANNLLPEVPRTVVGAVWLMYAGAALTALNALVIILVA